MVYSSEVTLSPASIAQGYVDLYERIYSRSPQVVYMGNSWYRINGELIHRSVLLTEIDRLRDLNADQFPMLAERTTPSRKSVVQRMIEKLRGMQ